MSIKIYEVGGSIRDEFISQFHPHHNFVRSKDLDYAVQAESWEDMLSWAQKNLDTIFLTKPEFFTIRGFWKGQPCDFTLCRKESGYTDYRHPDKVEPSDIIEDLSRRDFTINAIARDTETGEVIDPFSGIKAISNKEIVFVGQAKDRLLEDPLRLLRAIRFSVTKAFYLDIDIADIIVTDRIDEITISQLIEQSVSSERIREELLKAFKHSTLKTLSYFDDMAFNLKKVLFKELWLEPTSKGMK